MVVSILVCLESRAGSLRVREPIDPDLTEQLAQRLTINHCAHAVAVLVGLSRLCVCSRERHASGSYELTGREPYQPFAHHGR